MITAAELLAEIGDCRGRYPTRDALAGDAGQAAVAIESGKRKSACFRWACNKRLRQAFVTLADTSRHHNPWAQDLYAAASARGHDHPRAIRTVGRGWCRIVWRCWQDGVPYDPASHRALQRHVTVTIPTSSGPRPDTAATQRMAGAAVTQTGGPQGQGTTRLTASRHQLSPTRGLTPRTSTKRGYGWGWLLHVVRGCGSAGSGSRSWRRRARLIACSMERLVGGRAGWSTSSSPREGAMSSAQQLLDAAGRRRSPATMPDFHAGRAPGNKGQRYAADPPTVDEIIAVMRHARHVRYGNRLNGLIVVLWRAGLRINEALSLNETDLDERRGSILVRHGKNDRRRQVGMDAWGWTALGPWLSERATLPVGPLFCVIAGPTRGHAWSAGAARVQLHQIALQAGVRRRFAPHQLRHAHAVELLHEGIPLPLIQRQLGHSHFSTTGTYLQGISSEEIISTVHARRAPMMHASAGLAL